MKRELIRITAGVFTVFCALAAHAATHVSKPVTPPAPVSVAAPPVAVGIVAVVNDQVISTVDFTDRVMLVLGMTGIPDTPENHARIAPQILRQLIDEKLQMQDAVQNSITITDAKLHDSIRQIEKQSNRAPGSLEEEIQSKGLSKLSFYAQVRAQIAWSEIVLKKIRPKIRISSQEVLRYTEHKSGSAGGAQEVLIAAIQLPVDSPKNEAGVKALAEKLAGEIHTGASFEAVAAQFSSGTGGTKVTDPFWVEVAQMDPLVSAALAQIPKGGVTDPIRTPAGYQIIKLSDTRQAPVVPAQALTAARSEIAYKQILMTLKPDAQKKEAELLLQLAKEVAKAPGRCDDKNMAGAGDLADLDFSVTLTRAISSDMSDKLRDLLMNLKVGSVSDPIITPEGIRLFMVCERIELPASEAPSPLVEDAIRQAIYKEKLELEAQKYLRNLRREAFIEIRQH